MGVKDNFTQEEWSVLLNAPMLVSYAVARAAPSVEEDFIQEMYAVADAIIEGGQSAKENSSLGAAVADIVANAEDERRGQTEREALGWGSQREGAGELSGGGRLICCASD